MQGSEDQAIQEKLFLRSPAIRNPLLFSAGIHLFITLVIFFPSSFFTISTRPEIYSVELIDLTEPQPDPIQELSPPQPIIKPKPVEEPAVSTKPVLSTRNIPQTPTEIKILRPRKEKIDSRKNQTPIDQTMVFAALQRIKKQEKELLAQKELQDANTAVELANEDAMQALRQSILSRQPHESSPSTSSTTTNQTEAESGGSQQGLRANTVLTQYIATIGHHIGQHWRLPEGQKWESDLTTTVLVKIKLDGIVTSTKIHESSNSKQFDKFVLETIKKASPFPSFPVEVEYKPLKLHFYPKGLQ